VSAPPGDGQRDLAAAPASAPDPDPMVLQMAQVIGDSVRAQLDEVLPHVVTAIRQNHAFDELNTRLSRAERRLETRRERPLVVALHGLLIRLRHLEFDPEIKGSLDAELVKILQDAGFDEIGRTGEQFDLERHDALGGRTSRGKGTVTAVYATGLSSFGDVIVRAQVEVAPESE
jgi:hypothetical protein